MPEAQLTKESHSTKPILTDSGIPDTAHTILDEPAQLSRVERGGECSLTEIAPDTAPFDWRAHLVPAARAVRDLNRVARRRDCPRRRRIYRLKRRFTKLLIRLGYVVEAVDETNREGKPLVFYRFSIHGRAFAWHQLAAPARLEEGIEPLPPPRQWKRRGGTGRKASGRITEQAIDTREALVRAVLDAAARELEAGEEVTHAPAR